jgi:hypothetical protein
MLVPGVFSKCSCIQEAEKSDLHGPSLILNNGTVSSVGYEEGANKTSTPLTVNKFTAVHWLHKPDVNLTTSVSLHWLPITALWKGIQNRNQWCCQNLSSWRRLSEIKVNTKSMKELTFDYRTSKPLSEMLRSEIKGYYYKWKVRSQNFCFNNTSQKLWYIQNSFQCSLKYTACTTNGCWSKDGVIAYLWRVSLSIIGKSGVRF